VQHDQIARREFLGRTGVTLAGLAAAGCLSPSADTAPAAVTATADAAATRNTGAAAGGTAASRSNDDGWLQVRQDFALSDDHIHMSALLIASHPRPVRHAIDTYRRELDANPVRTLVEHNRDRRHAVRAAAAAYLGVRSEDIALTDSTTMGVGLMYSGLRLGPDEEILTTEQDYFVTHEAVRQASERTGAQVRRLNLYDNIDDVSEDRLVEVIASGIQPQTRVLAVTWVHSSTGLKLPIARLASAVRDVNRSRDAGDRVWLCVDGVHGFGVEDVTLPDLGCDFFAAGCHKWLFGPRGTGILWASGDAWAITRPAIPSFIDDDAWGAWMSRDDPEEDTSAARMTPGGFKAFEHQWAMTEAFAMHEEIGKAAIAERTHALATALKEGLAGIPHVRLVTPRSTALSAGIVSFDVDGMTAPQVVSRLRDDRIIASVTPYAVRHARLTPSIRNTFEEVDRVVESVRGLR
jgi:isopenicillin-N epimerase